LRRTIYISKYAKICGGIIAGTLGAIRELKLNEEVELVIDTDEDNIEKFNQVIESLERLRIIEVIERKEPNKVVVRRVKTLI